MWASVFGKTQTVDSETIRRIFHKHGYRKCRPRSVPRLTYLQQLRRLKWAREFKCYNWCLQMKKSWAKRPDGPSMVWMCEGESHNPACTRKLTKFQGGGIMVWGAISQFKKYPLILIEGTLDAVQYQHQILEKFAPQMPRASRKRLILTQDGATAHTAASTTQWLQMQNVELFLWWPANSPDANPIENVWSWMEKRLKHRQCANGDDQKIV